MYEIINNNEYTFGKRDLVVLGSSYDDDFCLELSFKLAQRRTAIIYIQFKKIINKTTTTTKTNRGTTNRRRINKYI